MELEDQGETHHQRFIKQVLKNGPFQPDRADVFCCHKVVIQTHFWHFLTTQNHP